MMVRPAGAADWLAMKRCRPSHVTLLVGALGAFSRFEFDRNGMCCAAQTANLSSSTCTGPSPSS